MKKILSLMLAFVMCLVLCACGGNSSDKVVTTEPTIDEVNNEEPTIDEDSSEEDISDEATSENSSEEDISDEATSENSSDNDNSEVKEEDSIIDVELGSTIETEFMEMVIGEVLTTERLVPVINSRGDTVIMAEMVEGKTVIYLTGTIKNWHTEAIGGAFRGAQCIWGDVCFRDKYHYELDAYIINGGDMSGVIDPICTGTYYLCASIPNELMEYYETATFTFGFVENLEAYDMNFGEGFSIEKCPYKYSVSINEN